MSEEHGPLQKTGEFKVPILGKEKCALCDLEAKSLQDAANFVQFTPQLWVTDEALEKGKFVKNETRFICQFCYVQVLRDYLIRFTGNLDMRVRERPAQA